ncbi:Putative carbohydrate metabolism domain-containing protein [Fibrobacter sp. UWCM]|uniref:PCMD domain-containing protein n=1 Tax=Fibrobacter sp. UWCM TaxID=1896208 RepID=UPI000912A9B7|nr:PCMD domain-containing protein [Fibrobacter sp. UWCM]SHH11475.1 Putative carbohydrate metabolism domain-containing protein [Fibrobacter sp. UWCM]
MRFEFHGKMKSFIAGALCSLAFGLWACSGETETQVAAPDLSELFENVDDAEIDVESRSIVLPEGTSSFKVDNIAALGGNKCYLALDDDPVDPEIDWDNPVSTGTELEIGEEGLRLVVLDDANRVIAVWTVSLPEVQSSSSVAPSSSSAEPKSSSDAEKVSSCSEKAESSSSEKPAESSSSSVAPASSSEIASSSSEDASSSSEVSESSSSAESSSSVAESSSSEREEPQLPGSDFSARNDFWATTSDAMATEKTSAAIKVTSEANLEFNGGMATITTREVEGSFLFIDGSWKMAGGFYFAGSYAGETALDIYEQGSDGGTPSTGCSDISKDMTFGKPFTARPTAFTVKYSYSHVANESTDYPQKSLVYVMLVGKNGKVVATGAFSDEASVEMKSRTVELSYGKDPFGLLSGEYPVAEGLSLGTGEEEVTSIHVMFASSAYAHVVCGGLVGNSGKYRGGENSALVLDDFKLIY